ncbi:hypothetical protein H012_gp566 [Acanthamoeba polyphaga moumouvirus]|uniref:Uncharacterized protein n=1 Tax=Acanthamoeba polyphaga moumouvirus TaxID=1269028 RepID=L7RC91_9VIRU|nr:hypothetical protein H012_gp566 [Acanthamoeba polyphaga moumouvirus]AGC01897.1 hypothetical protein Moumou_00357 [Acanthamoeba polyphaga moumouvirus]
MLTDNYQSINNILSSKRAQIPLEKKEDIKPLENKPAFFSQFDIQTFDSTGDPSAVNDIYQTNDKNKLSDLERKLSYQGGWTQYGGDTNIYGVIDEKNLTHNNMVPYYNTKKGYGSNDLHSKSVMNYKNDLFTGNLKDTWNKKQEISPMFKPQGNLNHIYGAPIYTEEEASRYEAGRYRQNEVPFEKTQVTPGLNLKHDEIATHGYHSMYRPLEKTVDELRVKPKITYEGRIIDGLKGKERPVQAPVISYRPETYKTTTKDDLLPTSSANTGPKTRDNFIMRDTNRQDQHVEYTGGAFSTNEKLERNIPEHMRSKHKASTRQNFILPKPLQKFAKDESKFNPNINSYDQTATLKDTVINNDRTGILANNTITYANLTDNARDTLKQITSSLPQQNTNIKSNTMRGTVHNMDIANPTIKETTIENKISPTIINSNNSQRVYYNDIARPTIKETVLDQLVPQNCTQHNNIYANLTDETKTTIKETTNTLNRNNFVTPINQQQRADIMDTAKNTIKQTTNTINRNTITTPVGQQQRADIQDTMKSTTKETTTHVNRNNFITPINQQQRADIHDVAKNTTKETTVATPWNTFTTPINQQQRADIQYTAKTTIKETTVPLYRNNNMTPIDQQQRADIQDITRTTTKETTTPIYRNNFVTPINQQQRADIQDMAKSTMKETTVPIHRNNFITPIDQEQRADIHDVARNTMKETTVPLYRNTIATPIGQQQRGDIQDTAKCTTKETTVPLYRNNFVTPINQQQRADIHDVARNTTKETTIPLYRNTIMTPVGQQQRGDIMDTTKTTIKETTAPLQRNNFITPVNQQQRADIQDTTKTTIKETTVPLYRNTILTPIGQQQRGNIMDTTKTTIKETTVPLQRNNFTTGVGQQQGANIMDKAKSTIKETTIEIPYNNNITAVGQNQRVLNLQDSARKTIKETVNCLQRNTNITNTGENRGQADTFDRTPLRTVTKEFTVTKPHNTHTVATGQYQRAPHPQDIAKTTIKESTIEIPYNNVITSINQNNGQASTFNRTPLRETVKQTTIDNDYIGSVNHNTNGTGYGYLSEKKQAPNTTRQFTCQEVYITPVTANNKNRSYNDAYNFEPDDKKESVKIYRSPTNSGVKVGPDVENINIQLRDDNNISREPITGTSFNNQLDRPDINIQCKTNTNVDSYRFVDPSIVKQLQNNPFNIKYCI